MAYSDFDLKTVRERFSLDTDEQQDLFSKIPPLEPSARLLEMLEVWAPTAIAMNTEKARSEMMIAPILMDAIRLAKPPVRLFSGVAFNVDHSQGLNGACDFLLTRSKEIFYILQPVVAVVEAKKEDIPGGLGQCVAEMVAARLFNEREGGPQHPIRGAVTTGNIWRFLKLDGATVFIDRVEYHLPQLKQILGIVVALAAGEG